MRQELHVVYRTAGNGAQERRIVELREVRDDEPTLPITWDLSSRSSVVRDARCEITMAFVDWLNHI